MPELRGLPPGRSGRLWLLRRLATAERGSALLDRKLRVLRGERERLRVQAERTGARWADTCAEANLWLVRAAMLGGQREIRLATDGVPAIATVTWQAVMGVRFPAETTVTPAERASAVRGGGTAALTEASSAYATALDAAVAHAAAAGALRAVESDIDATFRRWRAISEHWIPRLRQVLSGLTQRLEEIERDENARLRRSSLQR